MDKATLRASRREVTGSRAARRARRSNAIPAILYGSHGDPQPIQISQQEFETLVREGLSETTLINLLLDDEKESDRLTLIRDVDRDPLRDTLRHIDFLHIDVTRTIGVEIPLRLTGDAAGVKMGGILEQRIHAIEIECLPTEIPSPFEVDVSHLEIGDAIHLKEVDLGPFETTMNLERAVAMVAAPRLVEAEEEAEEEELLEPALVGEEEDQEAAAPAEEGAGGEE